MDLPIRTRVLGMRQGTLNENDELARALRLRLQVSGVSTVHLVSSPGSGKTTLLERTLTLLQCRGCPAAALVGDPATGHHARRLAGTGAPVREIPTEGYCHLEATMISDQLADWELSSLAFLFIENVGDFVCPTYCDLGEDMRVVLLAVTEGEDKPLHYPAIFRAADLVIVTKMDLAEACEFDLAIACKHIEAVHPGVRVLSTSALTGLGMEEWIGCLETLQQERQAGV